MINQRNALFFYPPYSHREYDKPKKYSSEGGAKLFYKNIGFQIRRLREQQGMTQNDLGEKSGFSQSYIAKIETGRAIPSLKRLEKLAEVLGVGIKDLLEGGK